MGNPFTAKLLDEITEAQLSCTADKVDRKEMWILLDRIEQHLRALDEHNSEMCGLLSKIGRAKVRIGHNVIPPALTSQGITFVEYEPLND
jgi:hypothetical protein